MSDSRSFIYEGANVADTAKLGDYVVVYLGARIEDSCSVLGFTQIWGGVNLEREVTLEAGVALEKPTTVSGGIYFKSGCRVGVGAIICKGVSVGEFAIVEPGSLVTQSVPPYAIVSGAPARIIGYVESTTLTGGAEGVNIRASQDSRESVVKVGVGGVTLHRFKSVQDMRGDLSVGEFPKDIPFEPKRYFLVFNVPSEETRGEHAHHQCHQFLICVKGSCAVVADDGESRCEILLDSPDEGIYLPPMTWGIQYKYSCDAVLLVFASHLYDAKDYIRNYSEFIAITRKERNSNG